MYKYRARMKCDTGYFYLTTCSNSKEDVIQTLIQSENCPRNAIKSIKRIPMSPTLKFYAKQYDGTYKYMGWRKFTSYKDQYNELVTWVFSGNKIICNGYEYYSVESLENLYK